jgi:hypothetical protein
MTTPSNVSPLYTARRVPGLGSVFAIVIVGAFAFGADTIAADKFKKLSGPQIRARFTGKELSDGTHWVDTFGDGGILTSYSMGRKRIGKWQVQKDELCLNLEKEISSCFEVWLAGEKFQLKHNGSDLPFLEGVLRKPSVRN